MRLENTGNRPPRQAKKPLFPEKTSVINHFYQRAPLRFRVRPLDAAVKTVDFVKTADSGKVAIFGKNVNLRKKRFLPGIKRRRRPQKSITIAAIFTDRRDFPISSPPRVRAQRRRFRVQSPPK